LIFVHGKTWREALSKALYWLILYQSAGKICSISPIISAESEETTRMGWRDL
jgi:hypothetical protein